MENFKLLQELTFILQNKNSKVLIKSLDEITDWEFIITSLSDEILDSRSDENLLTGCLTFYETKLENIKIRSENAHCEDSVNFISSTGSINNIEIKGKYRRNFLATLREIETVAHWLLMFSFRGIYPSDIHELTSKNLDIDFSKKIEALQKGYHDEVIFGNPHVYLHRRHKTKYPMNILISLPPIQNLISFLRQTVSLTHPSISYMNLQDGHLTIDSWIKNTEKDEVDFLKILSITKKKNPKNL